jgi:hypothetical protein
MLLSFGFFGGRPVDEMIFVSTGTFSLFSLTPVG